MWNLGNILRVVIICAGVALPFVAVQADGELPGECKKMEDRIGRQKCKLEALLAGCVPAVVVSNSKSNLVVFTMPLDTESEDELLCLSSRVVTPKRVRNFHSSHGQAAGIVPSPFNVVFSMETGKASPMDELIIRVDRTVFYISAPNSDYGIRELLSVADDKFVFSVSNATHQENYLFLGDSGRTQSLGTGSIAIDDPQRLIFRMTAHSDAKRPVFPIQNGHRFQFNSATFSNPKRPVRLGM